MRHVLLGWGGDGPGVGIGHPELSRHSQYTPLQKPKEAEQGAGCVLLGAILAELQRPAKKLDIQLKWSGPGRYPSIAKLLQRQWKNGINWRVKGTHHRWLQSRVALGAILALLLRVRKC